MTQIKSDFKPARVIVEDNGLAVPPKQAHEVFQIQSDIIFVRDDGWSLGAPRQFESIAYELWRDNWVYFVRKGHIQLIPIEKYMPSRRK